MSNGLTKALQRMDTRKKKLVRAMLLLDPVLAKRIEDWGAAQGISYRSETIRILCLRALDGMPPVVRPEHPMPPAIHEHNAPGRGMQPIPVVLTPAEADWMQANLPRRELPSHSVRPGFVGNVETIYNAADFRIYQRTAVIPEWMQRAHYACQAYTDAAFPGHDWRAQADQQEAQEAQEAQLG